MSADRDQKKFIEFGPSQWLGLALIVLAIVFIVQNRADVTIVLLWINVSAPLWLVLTLITLIGFGAGYLFSWGRGRRR